MEEPDFSLLDQFFGGIPSVEPTALSELDPYRTQRPERLVEAGAFVPNFDQQQFRYMPEEYTPGVSSHTPTRCVKIYGAQGRKPFFLPAVSIYLHFFAVIFLVHDSVFTMK
jgi:hypothetical protein